MTIKLTNEKGVKVQVKKLLDKYEWFWWMTPANGYGVSGVSDFCAFKDGVLLVIETKFGKNKVTALQKRYAESILSEKGYAFVVTEKNLDALESFLAHFQALVEAVSKQGEVNHGDGATTLEAMSTLMGGWGELEA